MTYSGHNSCCLALSQDLTIFAVITLNWRLLDNSAFWSKNRWNVVNIANLRATCKFWIWWVSELSSKVGWDMLMAIWWPRSWLNPQRWSLSSVDLPRIEAISMLRNLLIIRYWRFLSIKSLSKRRLRWVLSVRAEISMFCVCNSF